MRMGQVLFGALLAVCGTIFGLQGIGVISGSAMSGTTLWTVLGPLIAVVGVVLIVRGLRAGGPREQ